MISMELNIWIKGFLLGFSIAAPVGPIGILCIRRTLAGGRKIGFVTGLGAATADAFYGLVAAVGLVLITQWLLNYQTGLKLVGGLFLLYLGLRTALSRPETRPVGNKDQRQPEALASAYFSTLLLTLTNPATILSFLAIFAGAGLKNENAQSQPGVFLLVLGVFCGSSAWWLLLSSLVSGIRAYLGEHWMVWINRCSGVCIGAFGVYALWSIWNHVF